MISMKVEGAAQFAAQMRALSPRSERGILNKMLVKSAEPIRGRMQELAPVEEGKPDMADHIIAVAVNDRMLGQADAFGMRDRQETESVVAVGPEKQFFYAPQQEFGNVNHRAQPFARPAFDEKGPQAVVIFAAEMWAWMRSKITRSVSTGGRNL